MAYMNTFFPTKKTEKFNSSISVVEEKNTKVNLTKILYTYCDDTKKEIYKKIEEDSNNYLNHLFLEKIGFDKIKNPKFSSYEYKDMLIFKKLFEKNKDSILKDYSILLQKNLSIFSKERNLTITKKSKYWKNISDENIEKLKTVMALFEEELDVFELLDIKKRYSTSSYSVCVEDAKKGEILHLNKHKKDLINEEIRYGDYQYSGEFKNISVAENEEQTEGMFLYEIERGIFIVLFDWNDNDPDGLNFQEYVEQNTIKVDTSTDDDVS